MNELEPYDTRHWKLPGWHEGLSMTSLLKEAYEASAALGADPTDDALERYGRAMNEIDRREVLPQPAAAPAGLVPYLRECLEAYRGMHGWQGLTAEGGIETFIAAIADGTMPVPPPRATSFEVETSLGVLSAVYLGDPGTYDGILVELRKPDGTVGNVSLTEVVAASEAPEGESRLCTWGFDGHEGMERYSCDPEGPEMRYPLVAPSLDRLETECLAEQAAGRTDPRCADAR